MSPSTRRWHDCPLSAGGILEAKANIVNACLQVLLTNVTDKYGTERLKMYVMENWIKHLIDADLEKGSQQAVNAARLLASLFHDGMIILASGYGMISDFVNTWFNTNHYSSVVRRLIVDHVDHLDAALHQWVQCVNKSAKALFEPLVTACSNKWLTKRGWNDEGYLDKSQAEMFILYAYSNLVSELPSFEVSC